MEEASIRVDQKRRLGEILGVTATGVGKIVFMDVLNWRLAFVCAAMFAWIVYVAYRYREDPQILRSWGFRFDNAGRAFRLLAPFALVSVSLFFLIGYFTSSINLTWHILPVLVLYPLWGTIQQFLIIGLVAGNLHDIRGRVNNNFPVILVAALLFGLIHYPHYWLVAGTFVLALLYGYVYLRVRNIFVLGIYHGWLGGLFFYTVLDRDPFVEIFGRWIF